MTFPEAIDYLYSRLPMFQNQGGRAYKPGLSGIVAFCDHLGNPQEQIKSVHVGGTNGKGSTSHMLASVLQAAGYRVGLYTSPHLKSFTERIRMNGQEVDQGFVCGFVTRNKNYIEENRPSFFEVTVAMAFEYFAMQKVDIAVLEVGMGGRLDSTNIITPEVSVITNIGWDHMQYLGNTLPLIAGEKAGIFKLGVPVVISELPIPEVMEVFKSTAKRTNSELILAASQYTLAERVSTPFGQTISLVENRDSSLHIHELDLAGDYQLDNLKGVLSTLNVLDQRGYAIDRQAVRLGLSSVVRSTGLKGRWQILRKNPLVICDTAHNLNGLERTIKQFLSHPAHRYHFVLGFVADKDVRSILSLFPSDAMYYFCQPSVQRALAVHDLSSMAKESGLIGEQSENVNVALSCAVARASPLDAIYVGGSTFVVADLKQI